MEEKPPEPRGSLRIIRPGELSRSGTGGKFFTKDLAGSRVVVANHGDDDYPDDQTFSPKQDARSVARSKKGSGDAGRDEGRDAITRENDNECRRISLPQKMPETTSG